MTTPELVAAFKKHPIPFTAGVFSLALAVLMYFRMGAIPDANQKLDDKSALARKYELNIAHAAQLKEHLDAITEANKTIDSRLIRAREIGINQQFFYKLESDSGVRLVDLRQGNQAPAKGGFAPVSFTVALEGDFPQVLRFLRGLESGTHYCRITQASCSGGRGTLLNLTLTLQLLGRP